MLKLILAMLLFTITLYSNDRALVRQQHQSEQRVALVIGNNNYKGEYLSKLHNPINDALAIKKVLESKNFKVIYAQDVTSRTMKLKLSEFYKSIRNGGVGLLYFSGHGMEFDGENYLIPVDAQINEKSEVSIDSIAVNTITKRMTRANNRLNVVVLDACRNDPFAKGGSGGLAKIDPPAGTLVAYATSAGKTASDGKKGENGAFTKYLIKYIKQKDLSLTQVFKKTRISVYKDTNKRQKPAVYDEIIGEDFFFTLPTKNQKSKSTPQVNANAENELWSMVKSSNTIEDYNYYISSYPKGRFVSVANYKIKKLKPKKQEIKKYTLKINPTPSDAKVQITNIKPRYHDNMELKKGTYYARVSKQGYHTKKKKISLYDDMELDIRLEKEKSNDAPKNFVHIKAGSFQMGSNDGDADEKPKYRVDIDYDFYIGKYEVTVGEFREFINATNHKVQTETNGGCWIYEDKWKQKSDADWQNPYFSQTDKSPVVCVSHNDAKAYANWLNRKTGKNYRLPTEAEWEYVARAGTTTKYSFGDSKSNLKYYANLADSLTNFSWKESWDDGYKNTSPVGTFRPNLWGVYDMHGNVWEWCEDWYTDSYKSTPRDGTDNDSGNQKKRVLRGGSWCGNAVILRSANRYRFNPADASGSVGFRVVLLP